MQQIITTPTAQKLREGKFSELSRSFPGTITEAIKDGIPLAVLSRVIDTGTLLQFIDLELRTLAGKVNIDARLNLQAHQIKEIAQTIFDNFKTETLEDFSLAFRRGVSGFYGEIFRLDGAVIVRWIQLYLDEKYTFVENVHQKEKENDNDPVNYQAFQDRLKREREVQNHNRQKEIQRRQQDADRVIEGKQYVPMTPEQILEREIHNLWIKNNYVDGKKNENWQDEEAWISDNEEMIIQKFKIKRG